MGYNLTRELLESVENSYDIGAIQDLEQLEGGYWNGVFAIKTNKGKFVIRISHPTTKPESLQYEHKLLKSFRSRIDEVVTPLTRMDGTTYFVHAEQIISVYPFMHGKVVEEKTKEIRTAAAKMLAQLHLVALEFPGDERNPGHETLAELNWVENQMWDFEQVKRVLQNFPMDHYSEKERECISEIVSKKDEILQQSENLANWAKNLANSERKLLFAPIHGDYYRGNLLFVNNKVTAVIDWDECKPEWLSYELARATWEFCKDKTTNSIDTEAAMHFVNTYLEAGGPVSKNELDLLIPFIRTVRIIEVLFYLNLAAKGEEWDPEYTLHNLLSLKNLEEIKGIF